MEVMLCSVLNQSGDKVEYRVTKGVVDAPSNMQVAVAVGSVVMKKFITAFPES